MTRPTAGPEPVNCNTNQSKTMMVNWSPRYKMLSPSQSRWNAGGVMERQQQPFRHFLLLCTFARVPAGAFRFNLIRL